MKINEKIVYLSLMVISIALTGFIAYTVANPQSDFNKHQSEALQERWKNYKLWCVWNEQHQTCLCAFNPHGTINFTPIAKENCHD